MQALAKREPAAEIPSEAEGPCDLDRVLCSHYTTGPFDSLVKEWRVHKVGGHSRFGNCSKLGKLQVMK